MISPGARGVVRGATLLRFAAVAGLWATGVLWCVGVAMRAVLGGPTVVGAGLQLLSGALVAVAAGLTADRTLRHVADPYGRTSGRPMA